MVVRRSFVTTDLWARVLFRIVNGSEDAVSGWGIIWSLLQVQDRLRLCRVPNLFSRNGKEGG